MYIILHLYVVKDFYQMDFWFEFLNIHMNEKGPTCHDCHDF
jgi:hypothetical protein